MGYIFISKEIWVVGDNDRQVIYQYTDYAKARLVKVLNS